jgi:LAO/AO transport system kinase
VLLVAPAGGDELQGVKRGIMELADLIVVNKCDGGLETQARSTLADYSSAMRLIRPTSHNWTPQAIAASAVTGLGIAEIWDALVSLKEARRTSGELAERRTSQDRAWFWEEVREQIIERMHTDERARQLLHDVEQGTRTPTQAAAELLKNL